MMRAPFAFGDDPQPVASLLRDAGFANVTVRARPGTVNSTQSTRSSIPESRLALAAHVNLTDEALLSRIADSVSAALGTPDADEPVEFPVEASIKTAASKVDRQSSRDGQVAVRADYAADSPRPRTSQWQVGSHRTVKPSSRLGRDKYATDGCGHRTTGGIPCRS